MKFEKKNFLREGSASPVGCVRNVSQHAPAPGSHENDVGKPTNVENHFPRCVDGTELGTFTSSALCPKSECRWGGFFYPVHKEVLKKGGQDGQH